MNLTFRLSQLIYLAQNSRRKTCHWTSIYWLILIPLFVVNRFWFHHFWLIEVFCKFLQRRILHSFLILAPLPIYSATYKNYHSRLYFSLLVCFCIIISQSNWRITSITQNFATKTFVFPVTLFVPYDQLANRTHECSVSKQPPFHT